MGPYLSASQNLLTDQSLASSFSAPCLKTASHIHSSNLPERFCDDPFDLRRRNENHSKRKQHGIIISGTVDIGKIDYLFVDYSKNYVLKKGVNNTSDACCIEHNIEFQKLLRTVDQAANEILIIGREEGKANTAREMSNGLLEMKEKDEQVALEYCIKLYTKASFLYKACHHDLGDYYSIDDRKLFNYTTLLDWYIDRYGKLYIGTVYRGTRLDDERLKLYLTNDIDTPWYSPTYLSTSKSREVAEIYGNALFIINIQKSDRSTEKAVDISELSAIPDDEEVLLTPKYLLSKMKQPEFDPILKKHIIYLTSTNSSIIPVIQNNRYDYRGTKRKQECNRFSSTSKGHFKETDETDSGSENESKHYSFIVSDKQSTNHY